MLNVGRLQHRWDGLWWSPQPAAPMAALRIVLGVAALLRVLPFVLALDDLERRVPSDSSIVLLFGGSADFWLPMSPAVAVAVVVLFAICALLFAIGLFARPAGLLLAAVTLSATHSFPAFRFNHLYVLALLVALVAVSNSSSLWSVDARRKGLGETADRAVTAAWAPNLVRLQISIIYGFAAIAKLNEDFLSGATLHADVGRSVFFSGVLPTTPWIWVPMAVVVVVAEFFLTFGLWWRRTAPAAIAVGLVLHLPFLVLATSSVQAMRLVVFSMLMIGSYLLAIDARPRSLLMKWDPNDASQSEFASLVARQDLFGVVTRVEEPGQLEVIGPGWSSSGAVARRRVLDRLPITFLVSPFLRLVPAKVVDAARRHRPRPASAVVDDTSRRTSAP